MARISHMVLSVSDIGKSRDWYVDKLGFRIECKREGIVEIRDQSGLTIFLQKAAGS
jgi:catechol 2,3-dioxygenase-like lactoylglutathione lyase family enzyme